MIFTRAKRTDGTAGDGDHAGADQRRRRDASGRLLGERQLPRFAVVATDDLSDAMQTAGDDNFSVERARLALGDALSASQPVMHQDRFAGRADALGALIAAIEQQRAHVVLYGERGIGKTSLIHIFAETARQARYLVLYGSCGVEARFDELFRSFAEQIPLLYHASVSPMGDEAEHRRTFADLLGDHPLDPRHLAELFGEIVGTRVILVLDEYDRAIDTGFRRDVAELIKNLSDRAARVQLVLTGVASNLEELIGFTPSIRRNIVALGVGPMPEEDVLDILYLAEDVSGMVFTPAARDLIVRMAGGSPYFTRLISGRAAAQALDARRQTVEAADVIDGTGKVLSEWKLALPRRVQTQLQHDSVKAAWLLLITAARASGTPDGWFTADDVAAELQGTGAETSDVQARLLEFTGALDMFDTEDGGPGRDKRFRFRTQGVSQFLGLSAALARAG